MVKAERRGRIEDGCWTFKIAFPILRAHTFVCVLAGLFTKPPVKSVSKTSAFFVCVMVGAGEDVRGRGEDFFPELKIMTTFHLQLRFMSTEQRWIQRMERWSANWAHSAEAVNWESNPLPGNSHQPLEDKKLLWAVKGVCNWSIC